MHAFMIFNKTWTDRSYKYAFFQNGFRSKIEWIRLTDSVSLIASSISASLRPWAYHLWLSEMDNNDDAAILASECVWVWICGKSVNLFFHRKGFDITLAVTMDRLPAIATSEPVLSMLWWWSLNFGTLCGICRHILARCRVHDIAWLSTGHKHAFHSIINLTALLLVRCSHFVCDLK